MSVLMSVGFGSKDKYGVISGNYAHEIVLITSFEDSTRPWINEAQTDRLVESAVALTVIQATQYYYVQLLGVIEDNDAPLYDLALNSESTDLKGTPGSLFSLQSQDMSAKSEMVVLSEEFMVVMLACCRL